MAQKRISRARKRDLEQPDEFITVTSRLLGALSTHWKSITVGIGVALVLVVGVLAYGYFSQKAEERALLLLDQAVTRYKTELAGQDAANALEAVASDFETLLADYGDRQAGAVARILFAQMNYRAGRAEAAAAQYEAALPHFREDAYAAAAALSGLGYARAAAGEPEKAIAAFSKILAGSDPVFKADALYQMALLYRETGQAVAYDKAMRQLESDYPDFMYAEVLPSAAAGG